MAWHTFVRLEIVTKQAQLHTLRASKKWTSRVIAQTDESRTADSLDYCGENFAKQENCARELQEPVALAEDSCSRSAIVMESRNSHLFPMKRISTGNLIWSFIVNCIWQVVRLLEMVKVKSKVLKLSMSPFRSNYLSGKVRSESYQTFSDMQFIHPCHFSLSRSALSGFKDALVWKSQEMLDVCCIHFHPFVYWAFALQAQKIYF